MIKNILALGLFFAATNAFAGLPPTTIQGQADASAKTKFGFQVPNSQFTDLGGIKALIETGNTNLLPNASFENATYSTGWTITTASGAVETSTVYAGKQSAKLSYSSSTGDIAQSFTPPQASQITNLQMEASCKVNTTLATIQVCALVAGSEVQCQNASASGSYTQTTVNFIGPSSGSVGVRVKTSTSTTGTVYVDDCYVGSARNLGSGAYASDWKAYTPTFTGLGTPTNVAFFYRQVGDSAEIEGTATSGTTTATIGSVSLPTGLNIDTTKITLNNNTSNTGNAVGSYSTNGGTNESGNLVTATATSTTVLYTANGIATSGALQPTNASTMIGSSASMSFYAKVPIAGWSSNGAAFRPDQTPASWSGTEVGAGGGWAATSASYTDPSVATTSSTLTQITARNISCSAESTKLPGITCSLARTGIHQVCAMITLSNGTAGAGTLARLVDGSGTVINGGGNYSPGGGGQSGVLQLCGQYNASSVSSPTTFKAQLAALTGTASIPQSATSPITWSIVELDAPLASPYLTGSVTSFSPGTERWEHASIANSGTPSFTPSNSTAWLSSVSTGGTGIVTININSGVFSASPDCLCGRNATSTGECSVTQNSATQVTAHTADSSGTATNLPFTIHCAGPH